MAAGLDVRAGAGGVAIPDMRPSVLALLSNLPGHLSEQPGLELFRPNRHDHEVEPAVSRDKAKPVVPLDLIQDAGCLLVKLANVIDEWLIALAQGSGWLSLRRRHVLHPA